MKVNAYAKLNLYLDITGVRPDGYHELSMIMQEIDLCDVITVEKSGRISVYMRDVPAENNIALKAARAFFEESGASDGADIYIEKHIPMEAGLGGGSADAAAALKALNELYGQPLSNEALLRLGGTLGADVPFALTGGTAAAAGTGDVLRPIRNALSCTYVIIKPAGGVSTREAFSLFDRMPPARRGSMRECIKALRESDAARFAENTYNALTGAGRRLCPGVSEALAFLSSCAGCFCSFMTGSGSACAGMFEEEAAARAAQKKALDMGTFQVFTAKNR